MTAPADVRLIRGSVLDIAKYVEPGSVQCIVTSPPYYLQRAYDEPLMEEWPAPATIPCEGEHDWEDCGYLRTESRPETDDLWGGARTGRESRKAAAPPIHLGYMCRRCGRWRGVFGHEPNAEMYVSHTLRVFDLLASVLAPTGTLWWNVGDKYHPDGKGRMCIPENIVCLAQFHHWQLRQTIIWYKKGNKPESCRNRPTTAHEYVYMFCRTSRNYYDREAVGRPYCEVTMKELAKAYTGQSDGRYEEHAEEDPSNLKRRMVDRARKMIEQGITPVGNAISVQEWPVANYGGHCATFPEALPEFCIKASTKPGDMVLDPFAGTGTTGVVAHGLGRPCTLLDVAYQDVQLRRLGGETECESETP